MENVAYNVDCMEYMRSLPDKAFDLAVVDPPYGLSINCNMGRKANTKRPPRAKKAWDSTIPPPEYFSELKRVSQNQIIWGGNYFPLPATRSWIVWVKHIPEEVSFSQAELCWTSFDKKTLVMDIPYCGCAGGARRFELTIHPTQKPTALYAWIYARYAKPGDRILDTHLGSGSSRIAAYDAGLDFVGCEIDKDYFNAEEARFAAHAAQESLFVGGLT